MMIEESPAMKGHYYYDHLHGPSPFADIFSPAFGVPNNVAHHL